MSDTEITGTSAPAARSSNWLAVFAMMLGVAALISAELLPVSMLTEMAHDLSITTGEAGHMVSVTAILAMVSGLFLPSLLAKMDRRRLILGFSALLIIACLLIAIAQSLVELLLARALLGVAIGGFWAITTSVAMKLVPEKKVAAAISVIFSGVSLALVLAAPLGSYLGDIYGWRWVFVGVAVLSLLILLMQSFSLPPVPGQQHDDEPTDGLWRTLQRPGVKLAMCAMLIGFTANQMIYVYMRPYMEKYLQLSVPSISMAWAFFGIASFVGATFTGVLAAKAFKSIMVGLPVTMVAVSWLLLLGPQYHILAFFLIAMWGFFGAVLPIIWSTWITRAVPDAADSAGALFSAALQIGATVGATAGGTLIDHWGIPTNLQVTGALMVIGTIAVIVSLSQRHMD